MKYSAKEEQALMTEVWDPALADDPYAFVMFAYPWGKAGTPLESFTGPRKWQRDYLEELGGHIRANKKRIAAGEAPQMWRKGSVTGRGTGKSAMAAWRSHWMMSTVLGSTTIITANTEPQLKSRTFAEVTKWLTLAINGHWFQHNVLSVRPAPWFDKQLRDELQIDTGYYYAQGQLWSEENPDAFAGVHNPLGMQVLYDEASGIPQPIWNVTEGFFTEPTLHRYWDVNSNGRRNSGAFFDLFNDPKVSARWRKLQLDSRTVEGTDKELFESMIAQHGIDSDVVRVEILGQFPKQGDRQFISNAVVRDAQQRELSVDNGAALVLGVDIARFGADSTVLRWRQGRDARTIAAVEISQRDNMFVAGEIARWIDKTRPDAVCIDAGNGTGVIDRLRQLRYRVHEVWFGSKAEGREWANKRTELYARLREWLTGGCIDASADLFRDLTAPEFDFFGKAKDQVMLESKDSMRSRGIKSPDHGDALALTFAVNAARRDMRGPVAGRARTARDVDYPLFG